MTNDSHPPTPVTVLHVDAYPAYTELTATYIERMVSSFDVRSARTASEALDAVRDGGIDCLVSGYDLPDIDGLALLEAARNAAPDLPVIVLTAQREEAVRWAALERGATAFVEKSGDPEQFERLATLIAAAVASPGPRESMHAPRPEPDAPRRRL